MKAKPAKCCEPGCDRCDSPCAACQPGCACRLVVTKVHRRRGVWNVSNGTQRQLYTLGAQGPAAYPSGVSPFDLVEVEAAIRIEEQAIARRLREKRAEAERAAAEKRKQKPTAKQHAKLARAADLADTADDLRLLAIDVWGSPELDHIAREICQKADEISQWARTLRESAQPPGETPLHPTGGYF